MAPAFRRRLRPVWALRSMPSQFQLGFSLRTSGSAVFCRLAGPRRPGFAVPKGLLSGWRSLCPVGLLRRLCPVLVGRLLFAPLRFSDALIRMLHKYCLCTAHLDLKAADKHAPHGMVEGKKSRKESFLLHPRQHSQRRRIHRPLAQEIMRSGLQGTATAISPETLPLRSYGSCRRSTKRLPSIKHLRAAP